ncbi:hypothetical protein GIB67_042902 [Kingdonia uniflora]|uniref:Phytocyanin domain-containing protein n=1 Tax=Kingdonia uniflora TaxID=39325 RepID=A0A7J7P3J4_9MAGN|nr:hypothetical protein GIB67_042902 [Kingdonia uniflora]
MALKQLLITLALVAVVLSQVTLATEYVVRDESGWTINFDYAAWAKDKEFYVGNKIGKALTTGNDVITLATQGNKWYICGVGKYCEAGGMKLAITVYPAQAWTAPVPAPAPYAWAPTPLPYTWFRK